MPPTAVFSPWIWGHRLYSRLKPAFTEAEVENMQPTATEVWLSVIDFLGWWSGQSQAVQSIVRSKVSKIRSAQDHYHSVMSCVLLEVWGKHAVRHWTWTICFFYFSEQIPVVWLWLCPEEMWQYQPNRLPARHSPSSPPVVEEHLRV